MTPIRSVFPSAIMWLSLAALSLVTHLWWALSTTDAIALARCGATWVVLAGALIARPIMRQGYGKWFESTQRIDGGHVIPTAEEIEEDRQQKLDARSIQVFGPLLGIAGTLLWAYGDVLFSWTLAALQDVGVWPG